MHKSNRCFKLELEWAVLIKNYLKKARKLFKKKEKSCTKSDELLEGLKVAPNLKSCSKVAEQLMNSPRPYTESALSFLNPLDILTVDNVYHLLASTFVHMSHKGSYQRCLITYFNMPRADIHTTKGTHQSKISANHVFEPTLANKCFPIRRLTSGMISLFT